MENAFCLGGGVKDKKWGMNEKIWVVNGNLIQTFNDFFNIFRIFKFHKKSPKKKIRR